MLHMLLGLTDPYMLVLCTRVNMKKTRFKIIPNYNFMTTATRLRSVATNCPNIWSKHSLYQQSMDNIDIFFDELKRHEIDDAEMLFSKFAN
jgi:hypothetical protein